MSMWDGKTFFSTVCAREILTHERLDPQHWVWMSCRPDVYPLILLFLYVDHALNAVCFLQTARLVHKASNVDVIVDIGPQPTVWSNMQTAEFAGKSRIAFTGKRGKDQHPAMLSALAALFENGFGLDFVSLYSQMLYKFLMTDILSSAHRIIPPSSQTATTLLVLDLRQFQPFPLFHNSLSIKHYATSWTSTVSKDVVFFLARR